MSPKPSNSPLPNSGVFAGGDGGIIVPGVLVTVGVPGVLVTVGIPGVFVTVGVPGVFVAVGVPGVFVTVGVPGVFVTVGVPGVVVAVGVPGVFVGPAVFVGVDATRALMKPRPALLLVGVTVGARTSVVCVLVGRALCVVPAD